MGGCISVWPQGGKMKKTKAAKKAAEIVDKNKLYTVEEAFE